MMMIQILPLVIASMLCPQDGHRLLDAPAPNSLGMAVDAQLRLYDISRITGPDRIDALIADVRRSDGMFADSALHDRLKQIEQQRTLGKSTMGSLTNAIHDLLEPAFDEDINRFVDLRHGTLAVVATPQQHDWVERFVPHASAFSGMVDVQARIFKLDPGGLAELGQERSGQVLSEAQVQALLQRLEGLSAESVQAPRLIVFPFQRAELSVLQQHAYIQDFDVEVATGSSIADPVVNTLVEGAVLDVRVIGVSGGGAPSARRQRQALRSAIEQLAGVKVGRHTSNWKSWWRDTPHNPANVPPATTPGGPTPGKTQEVASGA